MDVEIQLYDAKGVVGDPDLALIERDSREAGDSVQYIHRADGIGAGLVFFGAAGLSFLKKLAPKIFKWLEKREDRSASIEFGNTTIKCKGPHSHETILHILEILAPVRSKPVQIPASDATPPALPKRALETSASRC